MAHPQPIKTGWLKKKSNLFGVNQKRFCAVLPGMMYVYKNQRSERPECSISLHDANVFEPSNTRNRKMLYMQHQGHKRNYTFEAYSVEEIHEWFEAISFAQTNAAAGPGTTVRNSGSSSLQGRRAGAHGNGQYDADDPPINARHSGSVGNVVVGGPSQQQQQQQPQPQVVYLTSDGTPQAPAGQQPVMYVQNPPPTAPH